MLENRFALSPDVGISCSLAATSRIIVGFSQFMTNQVVLKDLISHSYAMRCIDVLSNDYGVSQIFEKYPFLSKTEEVDAHLLIIFVFIVILSLFYIIYSYFVRYRGYLLLIIFEPVLDKHGRHSGHLKLVP